MSDLKKVFNAARSITGDTQIEAAGKLGVSEVFLYKVLKGDSTSLPLEKKIKQYIVDAGLEKSISDLGLDPKQPAKNLQPANN